MINRGLDWLEERTGLPSSVSHFMNEDIPWSAGWHQVFGSIALFCFLVQAFTGVLLAMNYAPTPGEAYNSVKYIATELTGGRMMRGLHHWGASTMIVVVVIHMIQVFLWGAYKKPREATWIVGVFLLLLTLAYGLTGYLLPWDNRAYWGTVVATQIAASAPGAGPYMTQLLGGEGPIGVVTFARFYAIHVLVLPPATMLLMAIHLFLVRKHGIAPVPGDETKPKKKFYPGQVFKDTVGIFVTFVILFTLAVAVRVPLERLADPTDTTYIPRPDWYFLFLFQMLKLFQGSLEIVGSMVLPGLAVAGLMCVPFIDRGVMTRVRQRTLAMGVVALAALGWTGLTVAAIRSTPPTPIIDVTEMQGPESWQLLSPEELAGIGHYRKEACASCHVGEQKLGPDLATAKKRTKEWLIGHFKDPSAMRPGAQMPPIQLNATQMASLASFILKLTPDNAQALDAAPQAAVDGAMLYQANHCSVCHQVNGVGMKTGPVLNGVAQRRTREWLEQHFLDPQKMSPGTTMPAYKFSSKDMDRMITYLLSIP
jgi:ubiquinol-cytochrome c reductase cytochrome b subunit